MDDVQQLFGRAIEQDDAAAMRQGLEQLFSGVGGLSAAGEFAVRHEDYVMEMPQSGERITGRDRMRGLRRPALIDPIQPTKAV